MKCFNYKTHLFRVTPFAALCPLIAFICLLATSASAQENPPTDLPAEPEQAIPADVTVGESDLDFYGLARPGHLAVALSDPATRTRTLITLTAVARLIEYGRSAGLADIEGLKTRFRDERAWLERLAARYPELPVRGSQLDPAAWFVLRELDQHQLTPGQSVSPLGPGDSDLLRQLFDRSDVPLAAAVLPEVLQRMEFSSMELWKSLLQLVSVNDALLAVVSSQHGDLFAPWIVAQPPLMAGPAPVIDQALSEFEALASSTLLSGPTDALALKRLRFKLLTAPGELDDVQLQDARYLLVLAGAVDGLNEGDYLAFTESLLWVVTDLLLNTKADPVPIVSLEGDVTQEQVLEAVPGAEPVPGSQLELQPVTAQLPVLTPDPDGLYAEPELAPRSQIPRLLSDLLPRLSNSYAGGFSAVDPRINAALAAVFDAAQYLQGERLEAGRLSSLRRDIADTIAQLVLLLPDMNYYFDQPVRRRIADEINVCTSITANSGREGTETLSREQFDGCLDSLVEMADVLARREELAGDPDGPFGEDQLARELMMPPWQRINFTLGYLQERFPTGCELPARPLPNPLEWSSLANMITWFARQSPVYFQTPENEALVMRMRRQGLELIHEMSQQVDCISGTGTGINDPVARGLVDYHLALDELVAGIREAELQYREERLKVGADVVLHGDASQKTAYRTEELIISPCDPEQVCEMSGQLEATNALISMFPGAYLIADQTDLGQIEICYQNMQWVNRRAVPVRADDPHVANYFGQLSFDLVGRYMENGEVTDVFGSNFTTPDEYHYLFAAATTEVQEDSCPTEWVGSKIVTSLNSSSPVRVVPDRLTYLASARERPSAIINANWGRGAQWRDWFITGGGVTPYEYEPDPGIEERVNQHLQTLYQVEQSELYTSLLRRQSRGGFGAESLRDLQEELTVRKALVRSYISLFYPGLLLDSDKLRGSLEGYDALLDTAMLRRFREANVAVASINEEGLARLDRFQADWARQSDAVRRSGSIATSVAHGLIRLNALYLDFFVLPAEDQDVGDKNDDQPGLY